MKRLERGAAVLALLLFILGAPAWAAPRVALVIPIAGDVKLGGAALTNPKLAEEGQKVSLGSGGEARIQLLGSSKEKVLKGKADYTISKANLEKDGKSLDRGSVSVVSEIGNLSRSGAATTRAAKYTPVGLAFEWPPVLDGQRWVSRAATPLEQVAVDKKNSVFVYISDLTEPDRRALEATITSPVTSIAFAEDDLVVGHQYRIDVERGDGSLRYSREFRILSPQEQDILSDTERVLRVAALNSNELPTLIRLATLYKSYDQNEKMAAVLKEAINQPSYKTLDPTVQLQLLETLNRTLNSLDQPNYSLK
jgi:hypothetical protein